VSLVLLWVGFSPIYRGGHNQSKLWVTHRRPLRFLSVFRKDLFLARLFFPSTPALFQPSLRDMESVLDEQFSGDTQEYVYFNKDPHSQSMAFGSLADCAADTEDWFNDNRVKFNLGKSLLL
jgi:hypothetical protein